MSSTQIQLDKLRVVSVHTQSITARSSVKKGTIRKLWREKKEADKNKDKETYIRNGKRECTVCMYILKCLNPNY